MEKKQQKFFMIHETLREGAMPKLVRSTLLGEEGVQTLDGEQHHHRKNYFMDLMTPERMTNYHDLLERNLSHELDKQSGTFELFSLTKNVLLKRFVNGQE